MEQLERTGRVERVERLPGASVPNSIAGGQAQLPTNSSTSLAKPRSTSSSPAPNDAPTPDAANEIAQCRKTIAALAPAPALSRTNNLLADISTGNLPALPAPGFEYVPPTGAGRYPTADDYIDNIALDDPAANATLMARDGFVEADAVGFDLGPSHYGAEALRFASPAQAEDFNRGALSITCSRDSMRYARVIPGVPDGLTYLRTDGLSPYRAVLVMGDVVVHLNICSCVTAPNPLALVGQWAAAVNTRYAQFKVLAPADDLDILVGETVPSGYLLAPDSVGNTGPSDLMKAANDDSTPGARPAMVAAGFVRGHERFWSGPGTDRQIVWLDEFKTAAGAQAYARHAVPTFYAPLDGTPMTPFNVVGIAGAFGVHGRGSRSSTAVVRAAHGIYVVEAISIAGAGEVDQSAAAVALAQAIIHRLQFVGSTPGTIE